MLIDSQDRRALMERAHEGNQERRDRERHGCEKSWPCDSEYDAHEDKKQPTTQKKIRQGSVEPISRGVLRSRRHQHFRVGICYRSPCTIFLRRIQVETGSPQEYRNRPRNAWIPASAALENLSAATRRRGHRESRARRERLGEIREIPSSSGRPRMQSSRQIATLFEL